MIEGGYSSGGRGHVLGGSGSDHAPRGEALLQEVPIVRGSQEVAPQAEVVADRPERL